jgi:hypothetical protein
MRQLIALGGLLAIAGCAGTPIAPDANPMVWTATYPKPFEAMTYCLNARSTAYQTVIGIDGQAGVGGVELISRAAGFAGSGKAGEFDVRRVDAGTSRVTFRSYIRTVGGSSSLEDWAREQAARCAE